MRTTCPHPGRLARGTLTAGSRGRCRGFPVERVIRIGRQTIGPDLIVIAADLGLLRIGVVAGSTERLPLRAVPEDRGITLVRDLVVDVGSRGTAHLAARLQAEEGCPRLIPLAVISTLMR